MLQLWRGENYFHLCMMNRNCKDGFIYLCMLHSGFGLICFWSFDFSSMGSSLRVLLTAYWLPLHFGNVAVRHVLGNHDFPCCPCQVGHFSRECPNALAGGGRGGGGYGGNFGGGGGARAGGGRPCYTCGQEGHFSRECPQASGGYASRGGGGGASYGASYGGSYGGAGGYTGNSYDDNSQYGASQGGSYGAAGGYDDRSGYPSGNRGGAYSREWGQ